MAIVIVEVRKVVRYEGVSFGTYIGMFVFKPVVDSALEEVVFAFVPMDEALTFIDEWLPLRCLRGRWHQRVS